jgi:hypothetical protein
MRTGRILGELGADGRETRGAERDLGSNGRRAAPSGHERDDDEDQGAIG